MFCKNCGSIMFPSDGKYVCRNCKSEMDISADDRIRSPNFDEGKLKEDNIAVLNGNEGTAVLPKERAFCPHCQKTVEAYFELRQMRSADEPETKFFRCSECNHRWTE